MAANGFVSLGTDTDVIAVPGAGPLAEPVGVAVAAVVMMLRIARSTARSVLLPVETALLVAVLVIAVPALVALIVGGAGAAFLVLGEASTSPYTLADALLAAAAGLIALLVVRAKAAGAGRPRWPWEREP